MVALILLIFVFNFSKILATYNSDSLSVDKSLPMKSALPVTNEENSKMESEFCQNCSSMVKASPEDNSKKVMQRFR